MKLKKNITPTCFILDVDGVLTTGHFLYTENGKAMKIFGPDDNDALSILKNFIEIRFVTGDKNGFAISRKRIVKDMNFPLDLVSTVHRLDWIAKRYSPKNVIYMGDGIFDPYVMRQVGYSISPANGDLNARECAHYVTKRVGGDRAVAEACLHILEIFFEPFDIKRVISTNNENSEEWIV